MHQSPIFQPGQRVIDTTRNPSTLQPWIHPVYVGTVVAPRTTRTDPAFRISTTESAYVQACGLIVVQYSFGRHYAQPRDLVATDRTADYYIACYDDAAACYRTLAEITRALDSLTRSGSWPRRPMSRYRRDLEEIIATAEHGSARQDLARIALAELDQEGEPEGTLARMIREDRERQQRQPDPGCGAFTHVPGTNGGRMPCGRSLKWPDGTQTREYCAPCAQRIAQQRTQTATA